MILARTSTCLICVVCHRGGVLPSLVFFPQDDIGVQTLMLIAIRNSNLFQQVGDGCAACTLQEEEKVRARSSACQHQARTQACPLRSCPWWKHQAPCSPIGYRKLRLGIGACHQEDEVDWCRESFSKVSLFPSPIVQQVYNASNNELVRTNTLVKGAIIQVDATPFRQWYESHVRSPVNTPSSPVAHMHPP